MAEGQVCCCGSNRGWLLFLVALNIISCILVMFASVAGIVVINKNWDNLPAEKQKLIQGTDVILWVLLVSCAIVLLVNLLPIIAEMKQKKPKLLLAYRNWVIVILIFEVIHLCLIFGGVGIHPPIAAGDVAAAGNGIVQGIVSILVTIFTLVLVQRRMKELQEEIGQTSFLKFM